MNRFLLIILPVISIISHLTGQTSCSNGRYSTDVYLTHSLTSNVQYGINKTNTGTTQTLTLDFYEPPMDTASQRPLIIWAHGGAFYQGSKNDQDIVTLCQRFSKKGFACASINYRLGISPFDSNGAVRATIRAIQDMKAAIRFFHKDKSTINKYKIDTNNIFIGGSSAGAVMALGTAFLDKTCEITPYISQGLLDSLGGLAGKSGNECYSMKINGVINLCGTLLKYGWIENGNTSFCSMHGTIDTDVPYSQGKLNPGIPIMYSDGSRMLFERSNNVGVTNSFYTWHGAAHMPYLGATPTATAYMDSTVNFVRDYLISQLGCVNPPLLPPNTPAGLVNLYPYSNCNLNSPIPCGVTNTSNHSTSNLEFSIFPNPTCNNLKIQFIEEDVNFKVTLKDFTGKTIMSFNQTSKETQINLGAYNNGIYFLEISNVNFKTFRYKIIKE